MFKTRTHFEEVGELLVFGNKLQMRNKNLTIKSSTNCLIQECVVTVPVHRTHTNRK